MGRILRAFTCAHIRRVVDRSNGVVPEHAHEWPVLSLFVMGGYANATELGQAVFAGPSAVLYGAGVAHRNIVGPAGFEQIEVEFDPAWLGRQWLPPVRIARWIGAWATRETRELTRICGSEADESVVRAAIQQFFDAGRRQTPPSRPGWIDWIDGRLRHDPSLKVRDLAQALGRHPSWLGTAYRLATGEGPGDVSARLRVARAAKLLRESDETPALIAAESGFCDQSHMIRTFRRVLGRTPSEARADRLFMRESAPIIAGPRSSSIPG